VGYRALWALNGTDGGVQVAIDAIKTAQSPHHFLSFTKEGNSAIFSTTGNDDCHVILRGGKTPNYDANNVAKVGASLVDGGLAPMLMIDCSHANSSKDFTKQKEVARNVAGQVAAGDARIMGVMVESHLNEGRQEHAPGKALAYGQSITDACLGWDDSVATLKVLAQAVQARRQAKAR
jgi:3-deoxy-7-phosphoheptulonate synthase